MNKKMEHFNMIMSVLVSIVVLVASIITFWK